ncbi:MAG: formylglycine-generating enzyme family protein [Syntrophales bacterium]|nr:formylglycine-generating enzyme family protein [Syntrophales bacterium]
MKIMQRLILSFYLLIILVFNMVGSVAMGAEEGTTVPVTRGIAFTETNTEMEFIFVKGGCYRMGNTFKSRKDKLLPEHPIYVEDFAPTTEEKPVHEVCVSDFYLGKYEVTNRQYRQFVLETGSHMPEWDENESTYNVYTGGNEHYAIMGDALTADDHPVVGISWHDAAAFTEWLSKKAGRTFRLPTEAQWEFAARSGGKKEKWAGTNDPSSLRKYAWFGDNAGERTRAVGQKLPNGLGFYDMSGNVWEWCQDWYEGHYYGSSPRNDPPGPPDGKTRVLRGGSWISIPATIRVANRDWGYPSSRTSIYGFRVAMPAR